MAPISSPPPPPPLFSLSLISFLSLLQLSPSPHLTAFISRVLSPARLLSPGHHFIFSILQLFFFFFFHEGVIEGRTEKRGIFSSPVLFRFVVAGREPFSVLRGKALQMERNWEGDGMEKVGAERREGDGEGEVGKKKEKEGNGDWWQQPCA